ncbi:hypothetical protein Mext_1849 [Methylorubrum extorquens PA1]|nr:hypothetical protein Mext_1849 [Methylorubrum extorquens PA1]
MRSGFILHAILSLSPLRERVARAAGRVRGTILPERPELTPLPPRIREALSPAEGGGVFVAAALALTLLATPVRADDKAACADGIAAVKARVEKLAPEAVPQKLTRALKIAEREQGEGEFDECLEALDDAKRALPK